MGKGMYSLVERLYDAEAEAAAAELKLDEVYEERARLLASLTKVWQGLGFEVWIVDNDDGWPIVMAMLPTGQVSWHVTNEARHRHFSHLDTSSAWVWDEHTTPEKYDRLEAWRP